MSKELRVVGVEIKDVLGATEFRMRPGEITRLSGRNGSGKSTALEAVRAALSGGNLCRLARVGGEGEEVEPEVVLVLEGEGAEAYRVERKGDKVRVRARVGDTAAFEDVGKPQAWLTSLFDPKGSNPVAFLTAPDKDRALMLLKALDLRMNRAELLPQMGMRADELRPIPERLHPLVELALIRDQVFTMRTGVNRDQKGKAAAADQTRRAAPAVIPEDPGVSATIDADAACSVLTQEIARAEEKVKSDEQAAVEAARHAYAGTEMEVRGDFKTAAAKLRGEHEKAAAEIRAEAERRVAALAAELEQKVDALKDAGEERLTGAEKIRDEALARAQDAAHVAREAIVAKREALATARERLNGIRDKREQAASARALHEQAKQFDDDAEKLKAESERLTLAIEKLDEYRRRLAKDLPIQGLEIDGKEIRVNGILYEQLNTQQRIDIAVKVATLRAKDSRLPVIFVDGAEALDTAHFEALIARLKEERIQAFVARVTDGPFKVEADPAPAETRA